MSNLKEQSELTWSSLLLIIPPLVVFCTAGILLIRYGSTPPDLLSETSTTTLFQNEDILTLTEAAASLRVLSALTLVIMIALALCAYAYIDAFRLASSRARKVLLAALCVLGVICVVIVAVNDPKISSPSLTELVGQGVFNAARDFLAVSGREFPIALIVTTANAAVALSVISMVLSCMSCLATHPCDDGTLWKAQRDRLKLNTGLATVMLVAGILFAQSVVRWPAFVFVGQPTATMEGYQEAFQSAGDAYVLFMGVLFSLILASYTLPAAAVLQSRAASTARSSLAGKDGRDRDTISAKEVAVEQEQHQIHLTILDQIKVLIAILLPFLAGTLPGILDVLTKL